MIEAAELQRLVQRLQSEHVTSFECEGSEGLVLRLRFGAHGEANLPGALDAPQSAEHPPASGTAAVLKSPVMGLLCSEHPLDAWPPTEPGQTVSKGQVVAFLRLGEVLLPVRSHHDAVVARRVAADGAIVGHGDPLFEMH